MLRRWLCRSVVALGGLSAACGEETSDPLRFVVVSFNTGTSEGLVSEGIENGGYTKDKALVSDQWYGDGLAFVSVVEATVRFFAEVQPDVVGFQEIFYSGECPDIPVEAHEGFVCETWSAGDPTVAELVLGMGYQVACHFGKSDKCLAVKRSFGTIRGCDSDLCLDGLDGARVPDCGQGSRVGRAVIDLSAGGEITAVNVHGSSGLAAEDMACRVEQFRQVFVDMGAGDGQPAANGDRNLVFGDLNTDPIRLLGGDPSADEFSSHAGTGKRFEFLSDVGEDATPTYGGILNIDHVVSDFLSGECWSAGVTEGHPAVTDIRFFDHKPVVCTVEAQR